jgi:hypothetical protein
VSWWIGHKPLEQFDDFDLNEAKDGLSAHLYKLGEFFCSNAIFELVSSLEFVLRVHISVAWFVCKSLQTII